MDYVDIYILVLVSFHILIHILYTKNENKLKKDIDKLKLEINDKNVVINELRKYVK
jgi:hypothetical protein